jgi:hypothetical protein
MFRILVILLIAVLLLAAFLFPQFRRSLWTTLVVVLCVVAGIIWLDHRQRELQHSRLPLSQIELLHMQVKPGLNARSYVVNGRLRNQSEELSINMIVLQVTLKDCVAKNCQVVGQEDRRIFLQVPPAQSRDFEATVPFSSVVDLRGTPEWQFVVLEVETQE